MNLEKIELLKLYKLQESKNPIWLISFECLEEITEEKVEDVIYTSLKLKLPELVEGLTVFFRIYHRFLLKQVLNVDNLVTIPAISED